jgi:hypothetical protein
MAFDGLQLFTGDIPLFQYVCRTVARPNRTIRRDGMNALICMRHSRIDYRAIYAERASDLTRAVGEVQRQAGSVARAYLRGQ